MTSPYAFTDEELKMMDKDYKKPKVEIQGSDLYQLFNFEFSGQEMVCFREESCCGQEYTS